MERIASTGWKAYRPRRLGRAALAVSALAVVALTGAAEAGGGSHLDPDVLWNQARGLGTRAMAWYDVTPPTDRVVWGGLTAAAGLALGVLMERWARLRPARIVPREFEARFLERLHDGELGRGKALDYCELNPSPAARVALAAVKRWGRPVGDLERAAGLAHRVEADRLRRNVGTLRRVAALTPLLGLLGTLVALSRALQTLTPGANWGPTIAASLWPLTAGVAIATLALVAYDGLAGRVEQLVAALDRIGAETVDGIAMALPLEPPARPVAKAPEPSESATNPHSLGSARTPHQIRMEVPVSRPRPKLKPAPRPPVDDIDDDAEFD